MFPHCIIFSFPTRRSFLGIPSAFSNGCGGRHRSASPIPSAGLLVTSPTGFCVASPPAVARSPGPAGALSPRRLPLPQVVALPPCWPLRGLSGRPAHCLPAAGLLAAFLCPPAAATAVRPTRPPWCPPPQAAARPPLPASTSRYELTKYRV